MVAQPSDPARVAQEVACALDSVGVPYIIGGSVASTIHGEPRGTLDVDFAVHMNSDQVAPLVAALTGSFYLDMDAVNEAVVQKRMFNAIHKRLFVKADIHVRAAEGHSASEMKRATAIALFEGDLSVRIASPEDVVLRTLWGCRQSPEVADRRWRDALGVLQTTGKKIDLHYLQKWSKDLGVRDLLERALGTSTE